MTDGKHDSEVCKVDKTNHQPAGEKLDYKRLSVECLDMMKQVGFNAKPAENTRNDEKRDLPVDGKGGETVFANKQANDTFKKIVAEGPPPKRGDSDAVRKMLNGVGIDQGKDPHESKKVVAETPH